MDVNLPALIAALVLVGLLGAVLWYGAQVSQPQPETVAGPPTGAVAMERKVVASVAMIAAMALLFLGYGLREPSRQVSAQETQVDISIGRGITSYTTLCFSCHGEAGQGAVVPDVDPMRLAPPLNRPDMRPTDPDERRRRYDLVFKTIQRGRPGTPMPAWGQVDGGTLLDEHINELTLMILNGDKPINFEGHRGTPWQHAEELVKEHVAEGLVQLPQQPQVAQLPFYQALSPQEQRGVQVALQRGCGSCHIVPNIPGATGTIGPSLEGIASRRQIAGGVVPNNNVEDLARWVQNPPALKPGTAMPNLGLTADESAAVAAYLYTLR